MLTLRLPLAALLIAASASPVFAQSAPEQVRSYAPSSPIRGQYIVVFKAHVADPRAEAVNAFRASGGQGRVLHTYSAAIKGFAAQLPDAAVQALRNNPNVEYIEEDQTVQLNEVSESTRTWGLDRIDKIDLALDGTYSYNATGTAVTAYIIDTGIRADHDDFSGRVRNDGHTSIADGNGTNDCNGHGTHVAGTVGGMSWGVAKQVALVPVRVLDCAGSGTWSGVIAGIDWVTSQKNSRTNEPMVANMSLGGGKSTAINSAVAKAVTAGVTMVVAAGNSRANACNYSPASEPTAITVGATTNTDSRASYSNYGTCLDIFAPGSNITSAWHTGKDAIHTISGTSMASPHVAGVAALVLQGTPGASPAAVTQSIVDWAGTNKVTSAGTGSPNRLLFSRIETAVTTIAVRDLTGTGVRVSKNAWRAQVVIRMRNAYDDAPVGKVTVTGSFSTGGSASCVTADSGPDTGSCSVESSNLSNGTGSTVFTVSTANGGPSMVYDASRNTDAGELVYKPK